MSFDQKPDTRLGRGPLTYKRKPMPGNLIELAENQGVSVHIKPAFEDSPPRLAFDFRHSSIKTSGLVYSDSDTLRCTHTYKHIVLRASSDCSVAIKVLAALSTLGHIISFFHQEHHEIAWITPVESELILARYQGETSKEIGRTKGLSHRTVEKHLENITRKIGASRLSPLKLAFMAKCIEVFQHAFLDNNDRGAVRSTDG